MEKKELITVKGKVKLTCTAADTGNGGESRISELEVIY